MFNEFKAAQVAAWFLAQQGGKMPHLKLMKLMYLAERASLKMHGRLITGDRFVSMPHGPVLTLTLNHIDDEASSSPGGWDSWISDKEDHVVALKQEADRDSLDEVSDAELDTRRANWTAPVPSMEGGYQQMYRDHVMQADQGADLDFLVGCRGAEIPRESH